MSISTILKIIKSNVFISVLFVLIISIFCSSYFVPDDIGMMSIVSGRYSFKPDPHIIFMNFWIGYLLSFLYSLTKSIEWYTLFFLLLHIISISIQIKFIRNLVQLSFKDKMMIFFALIFLQFNFVFQLQFTTVALNVGLASFVVFTRESRFFWRNIILGSVLLIISFSIRNFAGIFVFFSVFLFFINDFLAFLKGIPRGKLAVNRVIVVLIVLAIIILLLIILDHNFYFKNKNYSYFKNHHSYMALINDGMKLEGYFSHTKRLKDFDVNLIKGFMYDPYKFDVDYLKDLYLHSFKPNYKQRLLNAFNSIVFYKEIISIYIVICFLYYRKTKNKLVLIYLSFFIFIFCSVSLVFDLTLKERFVVSLMLPNLFLFIKKFNSDNFSVYVKLISLLFLLFSNISIYEILLFYLVFFLFNMKNKTLVFTFLILFTLLSYQFFKGVSLKKEKQKELTEFTNVISKTKKIIGSERILVYPTHFCLTNLSIFNASDYKYLNTILYSGWMNSLPYNRNVFPSFKVLIDQSIPIIVHKSDNVVVDWIMSSLTFNYGLDVSKKILYKDNKYYSYIIIYNE